MYSFFTLIYTLHGGLRVSIITDNFQLIFIIIFLLIAFTSIILNNNGNLGLDFISSNNKHLLSTSYLNNYTAGLTFLLLLLQQIYFIKEIGKEFMLLKIIKLYIKA